jgi:hypothetical protein
MTPNLFLATQTLFSPHKWFKSREGERPKRRNEHWDSPIPGIYEYIPGRGWYLIATDKEATNPVQQQDAPNPGENARPTSKDSQQGKARETIKMTPPVQVKYSKVLKRYLLAPDYEMRKKHGRIQDSRGRWYTAGFFRLDDGIAWVECWDEEGEFIPGPYKLWCIDQQTGNFRHMLKGDDPSFVPSRQNSIDGDSGRRRSQDSRSTQYRSGPASIREGPSQSSTRPNSMRALNMSTPTSRAGSQANSRRNSPKRSPSIPLDEAKERLKKMAEQQQANRSRGNSLEDNRGRSPASPSVATNRPKG